MSLINLNDFLSLEAQPANPEKNKKILKTDKLEFPNQIEGEKYIAFKDFEGYHSNQFKEKFQKPLRVDYLNLANQDIIYNPLEVDIPCLDIEKDILDDFTVLIIGRRRSGKSFLARWLFYHLKHRFPAGIVITGTKLNRFWQQYVPDEFVFDVEEMNEALESAYRRQKILKEHPELGIDNRFFIILDDVMSDKYKIRFSKELSRAFTDGRHYNVFTVVICQDPFGVGPDLRENADLIFAFRQNQQSRKEAIANNFMDSITLKKVRPDFLWKWTKKIDEKTGQPINIEDYPDESQQEMEEKGIPRALVINQAKVTENFGEVFKFAVACEVPDFILGNEFFWKAQKTGDWSRTKNIKDS
jgi:hypothetical protein